MDSIIDVLRHLVEHVGGWASDVEKAGAHAILTDIEDKLTEAGMITKPEQPEPVDQDPAPSVPSPAPATGTDSDGSASTEPA